MQQRIKESLLEHHAVIDAILSDKQLMHSIEQAATLCIEALKRGNKIMLCGNGGSAADAQHIAAELVGRFRAERKPLAAIALTTDTSVLTAIANDYGFDEVFARQVEASGDDNDILIAISTSGMSNNIRKAICQNHRMQVISLTGGDGGRLPAISTVTLCVPSTDTARIQECHILIGHILCQLIEEAMLEAA